MSVSGEQVCKEFLRVMHRVKGVLYHLAERHGLTVQQIGVLYTLHDHGTMLMGEVADHLHCDASNITGIIDKLVARELVERKELPTDRRAKQLSLTAAGSKVVVLITAEIPDRLGFTDLSETERAGLHASLQRLGA